MDSNVPIKRHALKRDQDVSNMEIVQLDRYVLSTIASNQRILSILVIIFANAHLNIYVSIINVLQNAMETRIVHKTNIATLENVSQNV